MSAPIRYIRFVTTETHEPYGHRTGVFQAAYDILDKPELGDTEYDELRGLLDWFKKNLDTPYRLSTSSNPHAQEVALSWFKPSANEHIQKFRAVISLVEQHDYAVEMLRTDRPGYVVYEDDFQIAATPFADTPR